MEYRIETVDGYVIRKTATRPYVEALVCRDAQGKVLLGSDMTTKAKHIDGEYFGERTWKDIPCTIKYEKVVAIAKEGKAE